MSSQLVFRAFEEFNGLRILIVGDVMLDAYMWGTVDRISPEAPVPVVQVNKRESRLGGAGNVARNIKALGAEPIICTTIGEDEHGEEVIRLMEEEGLSTEAIMRSSNRITTVKTRIIGGHQQILRVDEEVSEDLNKADEEALLKRIESFDENKVNAVIFQDYNKGVLTSNIIKQVIAMGNEHGIPTAVDPKAKNFFSYGNVTLFKPNLKEIKEALNADISKGDMESIEWASNELRKKIGNSISLVTLSENGIFVDNGEERYRIPAHHRDITDVSGAGDTVIAVATLCLSIGLPIKTIAQLANLGGGIVCEKVGVVPIDQNQLMSEAQKLKDL